MWVPDELQQLSSPKPQTTLISVSLRTHSQLLTLLECRTTVSVLCIATNLSLTSVTGSFSVKWCAPGQCSPYRLVSPPGRKGLVCIFVQAPATSLQVILSVFLWYNGCTTQLMDCGVKRCSCCLHTLQRTWQLIFTLSNGTVMQAGFDIPRWEKRKKNREIKSESAGCEHPRQCVTRCSALVQPLTSSWHEGIILFISGAVSSCFTVWVFVKFEMQWVNPLITCAQPALTNELM